MCAICSLLVTLITHAGTFHADDVLACCILKRVYPNSVINRVYRVPETLPANSIVFDIGEGKFDHHQIGGNGVRLNGVPYASAGLIWAEFGQVVVADTPDPQYVWRHVDKFLVQGVDAVDNGKMPFVDYPAQPMSISHMVGGFNPSNGTPEEYDQAFERAVDFVSVVLDNVIKTAVNKVSGRALVQEAIAKAENHIMVLDRFIPYTEHTRESNGPAAANIWFVVYPSDRGGWNWWCVPHDGERFSQRKSVPEAWRGKRDEELQKVTGIPTATFCHRDGFIGVAETKEDCIAMARLAVEA